MSFFGELFKNIGNVFKDQVDIVKGTIKGIAGGKDPISAAISSGGEILGRYVNKLKGEVEPDNQGGYDGSGIFTDNMAAQYANKLKPDDDQTYQYKPTNNGVGFMPLIILGAIFLILKK